MGSLRGAVLRLSIAGLGLMLRVYGCLSIILSLSATEGLGFGFLGCFRNPGAGTLLKLNTDFKRILQGCVSRNSRMGWFGV